MMEQCVVCKEVVGEEVNALECDLCDWWEHVACIWPINRPMENIESTSMAIMYVCSQCRKQGSVAKHLCK